MLQILVKLDHYQSCVAADTNWRDAMIDGVLLFIYSAKCKMRVLWKRHTEKRPRCITYKGPERPIRGLSWFTLLLFFGYHKDHVNKLPSIADIQE